MERINIPRKIATAFGGIVPFAQACGHKSHGTVYGWIRSGRIPSWRKREIVEAAQRSGVTLPPEFLKAVSEPSLPHTTQADGAAA